MSSPVNRQSPAVASAATLLMLLTVGGCAEWRGGGSTARPRQLYPPAPQTPRVVALGNLRGGPAAARSEVALAALLFGAESPASLSFVKPAGLAARAAELFVCDTGWNAVLRWDQARGELEQARFRDPPERPGAVTISPAGDRLVSAADAGVVTRFDRSGRRLVDYTLEGTPFRPVAALCVEQDVWVSNAAARRVEVFNADGRHLRSLGEPGSGPREFGLPLGLARTPSGDVCVVDMFKACVQLFDCDGTWLGDVGRPGDRVGCFGRPKDVAVGPDGTIFVTDAALQCVHAFDPAGRALLAFGQPGTGAGALALPHGITIAETCPISAEGLPEGFAPAYYVLVSEQLLEPGIRVYAWERGASDPAAYARAVRGQGAPRSPRAPSRVVNPHWAAEHCNACHRVEEGPPGAIPPGQVDALCRPCHDGHQSAAWAHPLGRPAHGPGLRTPPEWPLVDGRLGCLTCHDVRRHCSADARRPAANAGFLREYEPQRGLDFCGKCHVDPGSWAGSPHGQLDGDGHVNQQSCLFCHRAVPQVPRDGARRFEAKLRSASGSCLGCHDQHWDYLPGGHVDRPVPPEIRRHLLTRELRGRPDLTADDVRELASQADRRPAKLPLNNGRVACYTCHNPHQVGLFPPGSQLARLASSTADAAYRLRIDKRKLCLECHDK